jgi:hypothetical protein
VLGCVASRRAPCRRPGSGRLPTADHGRAAPQSACPPAAARPLRPASESSPVATTVVYIFFFFLFFFEGASSCLTFAASHFTSVRCMSSSVRGIFDSADQPSGSYPTPHRHALVLSKYDGRVWSHAHWKNASDVVRTVLVAARRDAVHGAVGVHARTVEC